VDEKHLFAPRHDFHRTQRQSGGLAENAEPLSEKLSFGAPAYGVLEVNAGTAARIGLKIGDSVRHPLFGK